MPIPVSRRLYDAASSRKLDEIAGVEFGLSGDELMERAGSAAFRILRERWPAAENIAVACGMGNNGGDGFVVARLAVEAGLRAEIILFGETARLKNEAACAFAKLPAGIPVRGTDKASLKNADLIVDALFGTGLCRPIEGSPAELVGKINSAGKPILALDIPSGMSSDTGRVLGIAVKADVTVAFIGLKRGLFTADGPDHAGEIILADLGVPREAHERVNVSCELLDPAVELKKLAPRPTNAHKGLFGHVLVIGGSPGMTGAALLAGEAALRTGAGLVSLAVPDMNAPLIAEQRPELMVRDATDPEILSRLIAKAGVIAIGPGLGTSSWAETALREALKTDKPLVIDADALNLLARNPLRRDGWILTPHPGEAARLLDCPVKDAEADRFAAARALQSRYGGVIILKGCGSLVCDGASTPIGVCAAGNPGMASGGMGDALTGVVAALFAQKLGASDAAKLSVCAHACAGDLAAGKSPRGLIATDLIARLRDVLNCKNKEDI
jgi:NAD(P)H-hydrate epimerase